MALSGSFHSTIVNGHYWLQVDWEATQNVSSNTSVITATIRLWNDYQLNIGSKTGSISINGKTYGFTAPSINSTGWHTLGTVTSSSIPHQSDGSKTTSINCQYNIQATLSGHYYSSMTTSANITLNNIPRASSFGSIQGNTIGSPITISITRASSSFTHKVYYSFGDAKDQVISNNAGTSCSFTPPVTLCTYIPNAKSGNMQLRLDTYSGSTKIGSTTGNITVWAPGEVVPTLDSFEVTIDNSEQEVINDWGVAVAGFSKYHLSGNAQGLYGSTIRQYQISGGYNKLLIGSVLNYTPGVLTESGNVSFSCYAIDSRGRSSTTMSKSLSVLPYDLPAINSFTVARRADNKYVTINYQYEYSSVDQNNLVNVQILYKKSSDITWTELSASGTEETIQSGDRIIKQVAINPDDVFDEAYSYNFSISAEDSLNGQAKADSIISTIEVLLDFRAGGKGLAVGKVAETDSFEINLPLRIFTPSIHLGDNTDLDTIVVGGKYSGVNQNIVNSPSSEIGLPFVLDVSKIEISPSNISIQQKFTLYYTEGKKVYERTMEGESFSDWVVTLGTAGSELWTGAARMGAGSVIELPERISVQPHGLLFEWQLAADGSSPPYGDSRFEPVYKTVGGKVVFGSGAVDFGLNCRKRINISEDYKLEGEQYNTLEGTNNGITYSNNRMVLVGIYSW